MEMCAVVGDYGDRRPMTDADIEAVKILTEYY